MGVGLATVGSLLLGGWGGAKKDTTVTVQGDTLTVEAKLYCHDDDNDDDDDHHHHHAQGGPRAWTPRASPPSSRTACSHSSYRLPPSPTSRKRCTSTSPEPSNAQAEAWDETGRDTRKAEIGRVEAEWRAW